MPTLSRLRRAVTVLALAGAALVIAQAASAHADLVSSDPADGATVAALDSVRLEFSEELLEIGNSITITDGAGATHELEVTLAEPSVLEAVATDIAPGEVTIAWRNASVDGHTEEGELVVTLEAPAASPSASPSPSPTPSPTATAQAPVATPSATPSDDATAVGAGVSPWLWGALGLAVIGGSAAAVIAATRRPRLYED
jgi:methionine-rich copper-binding protein CopC